MGRPECLPAETVSAYLDGELSELDARRAAEHVRSCPACTADVAAFARLDAVLLTPPALSCKAALSLLSARLDGEAAPTELAAAENHLASCGPCRGRVESWERVGAAIATMPEARPSARVDAAIAGLVERRVRRERRIAFANAVALRATVAVTLVAAVVALATLQPAPNTALQSPPAGQIAIVAAAQQVVLNPRTNTLYVAYPDAGTVNALNASTQQDIATIVVGGRPIALALNEAENRILVLDSSQKTLTEIDGGTNTVVSSTPLDVAGTLTSIQVEPASGKIVVASVQARTPSQTAASSSATGEVTVINGQSKKIEATASVPVAPSSVIVIDSGSQQTLLVSEDVTTVLDDKWKITDKLPGGIAAVFSTRGKAIAVLSAATAGARLSVYGDQSATVSLPGRPLSLVALPLGAYAALVDVGGGKSRIIEVAAGGVIGKTQDVDLLGREFTYNGGTKTYVVAGERGIWTGSIANPVAQAPQIVTPSPSPSATPAASASPAPSASPALSPKPVTAVVEREREPRVVEGARLAWTNVYRYDIGGRAAPAVVGRGSSGRLWYVDSANRLSALDPASGNVYTIYQLPAGAHIRSIEVGAKNVYAIDVAASSVYVVQLQSEKVTEVTLPFVKSSAAVTVTPDDTLWFAVADQILRRDPLTGKIDAANVGIYSVGAMASDAAGRVWFSDDARNAISMYDRSDHTVRQLALPRDGSVTSMVVDSVGTLWIGTDAGELFAVRGGVLAGSTRLGRPVLELALDGRGVAWYLTNDSLASAFGPAATPSAARLMPASVVGLWFDGRADAWLADRASAGFFIAVPESGP